MKFNTDTTPEQDEALARENKDNVEPSEFLLQIFTTFLDNKVFDWKRVDDDALKSKAYHALSQMSSQDLATVLPIFEKYAAS